MIRNILIVFFLHFYTTVVKKLVAKASCFTPSKFIASTTIKKQKNIDWIGTLAKYVIIRRIHYIIYPGPE
jgi:hypothetical protein